jgi:hypothetical protein
MVIKVPIEITQTGAGVQSTIKGLEQVEQKAKAANAATKGFASGMQSSTQRAGAFADAVGRTSTTLARSADAFGMNAAALRTLDDVMDVAELGFNNLSKAAVGFNAASIGVAGAGLAIGTMIGGWLRQIPAVEKAADKAAAALYRFFTGNGANPKNTAGLKDFAKEMGARDAEAVLKQAAQLRAQGMSSKDLEKFFGKRLTNDLREQLGLTKKQLETAEKLAKAEEKRKDELEEIQRLFKGMPKGLVEMYKAATTVSTRNLMMPGLATSVSSGYVGVSAKPTDNLMNSLMGTGIATSLSLSYSQEREIIRREAAERAKEQAEASKNLVGTLDALSSQLNNLSNVVGGVAGKFLGILSSISSGAGGMFSGLEGWKDAKGVKGIGGMLGKLSAGLGIVGSAIGMVSGVVSGIKSLFGGKSKEQKAAEEAAKKQKEEERKAAIEEAKRLKTEGLKSAQAAAEALMDRMAKGGMSDTLTASLNTLIGKVQDALLKSGLGYMASPALRESEAFMGAQGMANDIAQLLAGMRAGGALDSGLLTASGGAAEEIRAQAVAAAEAAGMSTADATKAGFGAIAPLLREQLNAALASGNELDANTRALIEEAKKNGIDILADPAIESVAVQKDMLKELQAMNKSGGGMPDASYASGTIGLRRVRRDMLAQIHAGEGLMVVPKDRMGQGTFASFARGTDDDDPGTWGGRVAGGGAAGGGSIPVPSESAPEAAAAAEEVRALVREVRRRPVEPVTQVFQPTFKIDPLQTKESREELGRTLTEQFLRDLRNNPTVQYAVQRAAGTR